MLVTNLKLVLVAEIEFASVCVSPNKPPIYSHSPIVSDLQSRVCGFSFFRILNGKAVGVPISNQNAFSFNALRVSAKAF